MDRKSAPRTSMRAAIAFSSFSNAIGIDTTINPNMSEACRWLTPLSRSYRARATHIKRIWEMRLHAMPARKSVSEAAMLLAVAVAFPSTINLLGTYTRAKAPGIETSTYSKPTNLPGFFVELMLSSLVRVEPEIRRRPQKGSPQQRRLVLGTQWADSHDTGCQVVDRHLCRSRLVPVV